MNGKALVLTAATIGVAIFTSVGLSLVAPIGEAQEGHPESLSPDSVFDTSIETRGETAEPALQVAAADTEGSMSDATAAEAAPEETAPAEVDPVAEDVPAAAQAVTPDATSGEPAEQSDDANGDAAEVAPTPTPQLATAGGVPEGAGGSCAVAGVNTPGEPVAATIDGAEATPTAEAAPAAEPAMEIAQADTTSESAPAEPDASAPAEPVAADDSGTEAAPMDDSAAVTDTSEVQATGPAAEFAAAEGTGGSCATGLTDSGEALTTVVAGGYPGGSADATDATGSAPAASDSMAQDSVPETEVAAAPEPSTQTAPAEAEPAADTAPSEPAPAAAPEPTPEPAPEPEPAPAAEPEPAPEPEPAAAEAPEPAAAAPAPKPKPATPKPAPKPRVAPPEIKKAWWPAATAGKLNLVYAGEASFTKAIALLFDGEFATPESANANIKVKNENGKTVSGRWLVASNPRMLLFSADPGLYTVEVGDGLKDKNDRALSAASSGPVFVP